MYSAMKRSVSRMKSVKVAALKALKLASLASPSCAEINNISKILWIRLCSNDSHRIYDLLASFCVLMAALDRSLQTF